MIREDSEIFTSAVSLDESEENQIQPNDSPEEEEDKYKKENTERLNIEKEKEPKVNQEKPIDEIKDEVKNDSDNEKKENVGVTLQHTATLSIRKESDIEYAPEKKNEISTANESKKEETNQIIKEEILPNLNLENQENNVPINDDKTVSERDKEKNSNETNENIAKEIIEEEEKFEIEINDDDDDNGEDSKSKNNIIPNNEEANEVNQEEYSYNPVQLINKEEENFNKTQEKFEEMNINSKEDDNINKDEQKLDRNYFNVDVTQDFRCQTLGNFPSNEKELFNIDEDQANAINLFSSSQINPSTPDYFLLDNDSKIEIDPHKDKSKYIGSFISYDINIVSSSKPSNKFTKCTRRYDNIKKFYDKLTNRYPYIYLPKLSSKKFTVKIIENESFLLIRKKELCFLLNYIYSSVKLAKLPECVLFINSSLFKEEYFTNTKNDFTYELKITHSKITNAWNSLKNYFSKEEEKDAKQMEYNLMFKYYEGLYKKIDSIKGELMVIRENLSQLNFNYNNLTSNFNYLKDIDSINTNLIENCEEVNNEMSKVNYDDFNVLFDDFLIYDLSLKGIVNLLSRYINFCHLYNTLSKEFKNYQKNKSLYSVDVEKIKERGKEKKTLFENQINEQINEFVSMYNNTFDKFLQNFTDFLKKSNYEEINIIKEITNRFSN